MIKVLGLALYGPLAASTRYRLTQFAGPLKSEGIDLDVTCLLGDKYLRRRFDGVGLPIGRLAWDAGKRLFKLLSADRYDLALLYCELFPLMPATVERALLRVPYIYDLDDAFYLRYRLGRGPAISSLLGNKFDSIMKGAAAVTAGSSVLAQYAARHNKNVTVLPTVVDTRRYVPTRSKKQRGFTIGWIGSPSTASYLPALVAPLQELGKEGSVDLIVVGGKAPIIPNVNVVEIAWAEDTEVDLINSFDVGVMPLPDDEWARGKCAFKLIQYMACGLPVVASPVGANIDVVQPTSGFLADSPSEWVEALRTLRDDPILRARMGEAGRALIEEAYSLRTAIPSLASVIRGCANQRSRKCAA